MPELIDKKRTEAKVYLIARFFIDRPDREVELVKAVIHRCCEEIDKQPTIEAEPVRHGRWILCEDQHGVDNDNNNYAYFCSQCHYQDVHSKYAKVNFCWNCGADMRGGGADNG